MESRSSHPRSAIKPQACATCLTSSGAGKAAPSNGSAGPERWSGTAQTRGTLNRPATFSSSPCQPCTRCPALRPHSAMGHADARSYELMQNTGRFSASAGSARRAISGRSTGPGSSTPTGTSGRRRSTDHRHSSLRWKPTPNSRSVTRSAMPASTPGSANVNSRRGWERAKRRSPALKLAGSVRR